MTAAIETLLCGRHELCFLDYHLGARTGLELLREALARGCRTPIIMLTGNGDSEVDVMAMEAGAADYLIKGRFGGPHLERSIRYAIGFAVERHQALEALRRSRGTVCSGVARHERRALGLGPGGQPDLLRRPLEVDTWLRRRADRRQHTRVVQPRAPAGSRACQGRDLGTSCGQGVAPRDRAPDASPRRDLSLGPHSRPGRAGRRGERSSGWRARCPTSPSERRPSAATLQDERFTTR